MKTARILSGAIITAALCLAGQAYADTLKIGVPVPLTGFAAESAQEMVEGFQTYLKQHENKLGGLDVELVIEDTEAKPDVALTKMRKLVENDKVDLVVGYLLAFEGYAVRDYANDNKVPLLLTAVAADDLTQRKKSPYIVRLTWTSSLPNHPFGEYAAKTLKYKRIAIVGQDYAFGWENAAGFLRAFEDSGGEVVQRIWIPLDAIEHGSYVSQINQDVDAVFVTLVGANIPKFMKAFDDFGLKAKIPLIGANIVTDEDVLKHMGDEALAVVTSHTYAASLDRPENKAFVELFRGNYSKDPSYYAESMYTAAMWLDRALAKSGKPRDGLALMDAVRAIELPDAPRGPLKIDANNSSVETVYFRKVVRKADGSGLDNEVIGSIADVSQFWTYDQAQYLGSPAYSRDYPPCKHCQ